MRSIPRWLSGMTMAAMLVPPATQAGAQCLISGPAAFCADSSAQLCADGTTCQWSGPNGFSATTPCITISQPGIYSVMVFDASFGIWFGPCDWQVGLLPPDSCGSIVPPPPPPGGHDATNCPRPAMFWERQFRGEHSEIAYASLAALAACVDARSALFAWPDPRSGLASLLCENEHRDLRSRVLRQFAAVLANLCAREESLTVRDQRVGLNPDAAYSIPGEHGTVGAWVGSAESQLLALRSDSRSRPAYRRLFMTAWSLSHGAGMVLSCPDASREPANAAGLAAAMAELDALPEFAAPSPNPFRTSTQITFGIADPAGADVDLAVFDIAGREIMPLARSHMAAGSHSLLWDGSGRDGSRARAGIYFVHGRIGGSAYAHHVMLVQ